MKGPTLQPVAFVFIAASFVACGGAASARHIRLLVRLKPAGILEISRNRRRWHTDEPSCIYTTQRR